MTAPSARKTSENSAELVPRYAPSDSSGMIPVSAVSVVAVIAAGVVPPITELFMVAPDRVMSSGTYESAIAVPCHSPVVMVPTSVSYTHLTLPTILLV